MKKLVARMFHTDEKGATMVEYAILVALISVAAIAIIVSVGQEVQSAFNDVLTQLQANSGS